MVTTERMAIIALLALKVGSYILFVKIATLSDQGIIRVILA